MVEGGNQKVMLITCNSDSSSEDVQNCILAITIYVRLDESHNHARRIDTARLLSCTDPPPTSKVYLVTSKALAF